MLIVAKVLMVAREVMCCAIARLQPLQQNSTVSIFSVFLLCMEGFASRPANAQECIQYPCMSDKVYRIHIQTDAYIFTFCEGVGGQLNRHVRYHFSSEQSQYDSSVVADTKTKY